MKVRAVQNFATVQATYRVGETYDLSEESAEGFIRSGHVEAVKPAKKAAAKKAAAKKVETASVAEEVETASEGVITFHAPELLGEAADAPIVDLTETDEDA